MTEQEFNERVVQVGWTKALEELEQKGGLLVADIVVEGVYGLTEQEVKDFEEDMCCRYLYKLGKQYYDLSH